MQNGICPKCSSKRIHVGSEAPPGVGSIAISGMVAAETIHRVCVECGYVESYVTERRKLARIAEEWPHNE